MHRTQARASIDVAGSAFTVTAERDEKASRRRWLVDGAEVKTWMLSRRALEPLFFPAAGAVMDEQRLHGRMAFNGLGESNI